MYCHEKYSLGDHLEPDELGMRRCWLVESATGQRVDIADQCGHCQNWVPRRLFAGLYRGGYVGRTWVCQDCFLAARASTESAEVKPNLSAIPLEYVAATLDDFDAETRRRLKAWPHKEPLLGLHGLTGAGKTHATWAIFRANEESGLRVAHNRLSDARKVWVSQRDAWDREKVEAGLLNRRFLILDDFTAEASSPGWLEVIHRLLEERCTHHKPTIITTALDFHVLRDAYTEAIADRFKYFTWVKLTGASKRGASKAKREQPAAVSVGGGR